jgi:uracil phosphoribosyltransferase
LLVCVSQPIFSFYTQPKNPDLEEHLFKIRDPQTPRCEFRKHIKKIGTHLAFAIANALPTKASSIETVLHEKATQQLVNEQLVIITVLRAGLPLFDGLFSVFPQAEGGFLVYQRDHVTLKPVLHSVLLPSLENKTVILADPMLATGGTILDALKIISEQKPAKIFLASVISAKEGLERVHNAYPNVCLVTAAVDPVLNDKGYIVPGLGDAGDRSYGPKKAIVFQK